MDRSMDYALRHHVGSLEGQVDSPESSREELLTVSTQWVEIRFSHRWRRVMFLACAVAILATVAWTARLYVLSASINDRMDDLSSAGLPTRADELDDYYPHVPQSQNYALRLLTIADSFDGSGMPATHSWVKWRQMPSDPAMVSSQLIAEARNYIEDNADIVAAALDDGGLTESRYPIRLSDNFRTNVPHLGATDRISWLLTMECLVAVADGDGQRAKAALLGNIRVAQSLRNEPLLVSFLHRLMLLGRASHLLAYAAPRVPFSVEQFNAIGSAMDGALSRRQLHRLVVVERASRLDDTPVSYGENRLPVSQTIRPANDKTAIRYIDTVDAYLSALGQNPDDQLLDALKAIDQPWLKSLNLKEQNWYDLRRHTRTAHMYLATLATMRCSMIVAAGACYQQQTGKAPQNIADLQFLLSADAVTDPFTGTPLRTCRLEGCFRGGSGGNSAGFAIYSVGPDHTDDGGTPGASYEPGTDIGLLVAR